MISWSRKSETHLIAKLRLHLKAKVTSPTLAESLSWWFSNEIFFVDMLWIKDSTNREIEMRAVHLMHVHNDSLVQAWKLCSNYAAGYIEMIENFWCSCYQHVAVQNDQYSFLSLLGESQPLQVSRSNYNARNVLNCNLSLVKGPLTWYTRVYKS